MSKSEKNKPAFLKPRKHVFSRQAFKRARKAKVFGMTTSSGKVLVTPSPLNPKSSDWIKILQSKVVPFLREAFPRRRTFVLLLDGEKIFHTEEAEAARKRAGVKLLPDWPSFSPDLNPQGELRRKEHKSDSFSVFRRRIIAASKDYPASEKLVPSLAERVAECLRRKGANVGK